MYNPTFTRIVDEYTELCETYLTPQQVELTSSNILSTHTNKPLRVIIDLPINQQKSFQNFLNSDNMLSYRFNENWL